MARLWDEYGTWLVIVFILAYVGDARGGWIGQLLAFNVSLSLLTTAEWLMDWFHPVRVWLPRLLRWGARCLACFMPTACLVYFGAMDGSRTSAEAVRFALVAGSIAASICLHMNVQADVPLRRRRP